MEINAELKKWGNSLGLVIPAETVAREGWKEKEKVRLLVIKDSREAFAKTFGIGKGRIRKTAQQMKDEARKELYND